MSRVRVTTADLQTYEAIKAFIASEGYAPSVRQVGQLLNLASSSTVYVRLHRLKALGLVTFNAKEPRTLRIVACPLHADGSAVA